MGLDGVELVMVVEEEFQIAISDSEANECSTVRILVELVHSHLRHSSTDPCPSQHSFYLARRNLISILQAQRNEIKPDTNLEEIIPKETLEGSDYGVEYNSELMSRWSRSMPSLLTI